MADRKFEITGDAIIQPPRDNVPDEIKNAAFSVENTKKFEKKDKKFVETDGDNS